MTIQPIGRVADYVVVQNTTGLQDLAKNMARYSSKLVKILIIDQPQHSNRLKLLLTKQKRTFYRVRTVGQLSIGLNYLQQEPFDLVMVGLDLSDYRGLEILSRLQLQDQSLPIIILANPEEEALALQTVEYGAADYLLRSEITPHLLSRAVRHALEQHSLRSKLQQIQTHCELLQQDVTATLREKQILLKEVHHRVKNNLQLISSLLSLQTQYIEDQTFMEILKNGQNRVKSLAIIQEQLYQFENLAYIDFDVYVQKLIVYLSGCYLIEASEIDVDVQIDLPPLNLDLAVPCGLILNELLTNAFKHAFPAGKPAQDDDNCRITIRVHRSPDRPEIVMSVADNGVGLPSTTYHQTYEKLGFKLIQLLAQQLEGTVTIHANPSTEVTVVFAES